MAKPKVSEILAFVDQQGKFAKGSMWVDQNLVPSVFWSLYADSDLSPDVIFQGKTKGMTVEDNGIIIFLMCL